MNQNLDYAVFYVMILDTLSKLLERTTDFAEPRDVLRLKFVEMVCKTLYLLFCPMAQQILNSL
jgi:hypothetical protein